MFQLRKQKFLTTGAPTSTQSHTAVIDTLGFDFVSIGVSYSTVAATNPDITFTVGEGDTTSAFTNITELVGGGAGGFTFWNANTNTSVADTAQVDIDVRNRKRYLLLTITPFTTKTITSWCTLGMAEQSPTPATSWGLMGRVAV